MVQGMSRDASDEFSKIFLVRYFLSYLCGTFYLDPSASLKRIFAFSVGGQMVVCPPYHLLSVELMLKVQQSDSLVIDLVTSRWSTLTVRSPDLPR